MKDCPFCAITDNRKVPAKELTRRGFDAWSFIPLNPVVRGHTLVIPGRHVPLFHLLAKGEAGALAVALMETVGDVTERYENEGYNIIQSNGAAATQTVEHVHFHIIPRRKGDGLALPWSPGGPS